VTDVDITVSFESGVLEVDIYLNVPDDVSPPADEVADEAARTAQTAVDELFDGTTEFSDYVSDPNSQYVSTEPDYRSS